MINNGAPVSHPLLLGSELHWTEQRLFPPISDEQHWPSDNATSGGAVTRRAATSSNGFHPLLSDEAALRLDLSASGDTMTGLGRRKQLLGGDGDAMAAKP